MCWIWAVELVLRFNPSRFQVKFLPDREEHADYFVSGSSRGGLKSEGVENFVALWNNGTPLLGEEGLEKAGELKLPSDVNDIL